MAQQDINLRDYARILRRRKWIVILVPLLFGLSSYVMTLWQAPPPLYRTTATVRIERAVSVTGLLQELVTFSPVGTLETHAALIKGFPVMTLAAKKLGRIPADATRDQIWASPASIQAIQTLQGQVEAKQAEGTSLIDISATASDPEHAARITNSVADAFQEENLTSRNRQVREARHYIEGQIEEVGARLRISEETQKTLQEARASFNRVPALEEEQTKISRAIEEMEGQLRLLDSGKILDRPLSLPFDGADPILSRLYTSLLDRTLEREQLLLTLFPTHPQIQQLDTQLANIRQTLRATLASRLEAWRGRADEVRQAIARLKQEQSPSSETGLEMARKEREVRFNERLFSLLVEKYQEALIKEKEQVPEVSLVRPAIASAQPINPPQGAAQAGVGLVIGLTLGIVLAFVVEALDTTIGAIDDVESLLQTSVLGVIPYLDLKAELEEEHLEEADLDDESKEKYTFLISLFFPKSRIVEAMRALRTNLLVPAIERNLHTLMITSATQREGKTTVAINLAIALAQLGKRTLLVESDLRKPFLHHAFGLPKEPGLTEVVVGSTRLEDAVLGFQDLLMGKAGVEGLIDRPGIDNLFILPSGRQPANPAELLSAPGLASFMHEARQQYDYVVLDATPILPVADASVLGSQVDGALLVVRVGQIPRAALRRAKTLLEGAKVQILGVCLTGVRAEVSPDYADMGYYHYRYRYGVSELSPSWGLLGGLAAYLGSGFTVLVLWLALALALGVGLWAWRTGHLKLPSLTRMQVPSAPSAQPVPPTLGQQLATLTPPILESASPGRPSGTDQPTAETARPLQIEAPTQSSTPVKAEEPGAQNHVQYTVVLYSFRTEAQASQAVARYLQRGLPAFVTPAGSQKQRQMWRVCAGRFDTQAETDAFRRTLSVEEGFAKFWVTRVRGGEP